MLDAQTLEALKAKATDLRISTIHEIAHLGNGHIGGAMSIIEVLTYLYFHEMNIDPSNPAMEGRDRFVCSKGHAGPAVYATLAEKGYFPKEWLMTLNQGGTNLPSHCDMLKTPGIDFTTGSLGQGASAAVGIALGQKIKGESSYTYLMIGDGESQEGRSGKLQSLLQPRNLATSLPLQTSTASNWTATQKISSVWIISILVGLALTGMSRELMVTTLSKLTMRFSAQRPPRTGQV